MKTSYIDTKRFIERVLQVDEKQARSILHLELSELSVKETEFCAGVIEYGPGMPFTANQWFDFFKRVPNKLFFDEPRLMNKLTENQLSELTGKQQKAVLKT